MRTVLTILASVFFLSCATTKKQGLQPNDPAHSFWENGTQFTYQEIDSVIVSIAFESYENEEYILNLTIDNRGNDSILFDPAGIYVFRYQDELHLAEDRIYFAQDTNTKINTINKDVDREKKRIKRNKIFSILTAAAFLTTEIVGITHDVKPEIIEGLLISNTAVQAGIDYSLEDAVAKLDKLGNKGCYWEYGVMRKNTIGSKKFATGNIHLKVAYSNILKIYVPINGKVFSFSFKGNTQSLDR